MTRLITEKRDRGVETLLERFVVVTLVIINWGGTTKVDRGRKQEGREAPLVAGRVGRITSLPSLREHTNRIGLIAQFPPEIVY